MDGGDNNAATNDPPLHIAEVDALVRQLIEDGDVQEEGNPPPSPHTHEDGSDSENLPPPARTPARIQKRKRVSAILKESTARNTNKNNRNHGKSYIGTKTSPDGTKKRVSVEKPPRTIGPPCASTNCKRCNKTRFCHLFNEHDRIFMFDMLWKLPSKEENILFVQLLTDIRQKEDVVRRHNEPQYYLRKGSQRLQVCREFFASTLCLPTSTVRNWLRMAVDTPQENVDPPPKKIRRGKKEEVSEALQGLEDFLNQLGKQPSHYCRANTTRQYLERSFRSMRHVHRTYTAQCSQNGKHALSWGVFWACFKSKNLSAFNPKKDACNLFEKHKLGTLEDAEIEEYPRHVQRKKDARKLKDKYRESRDPNILIYTCDKQSNLLCPQCEVCAAQYLRKLNVHNYTVFNIRDRQVKCYLWDESEAGLDSSVFATSLIKQLTSDLEAHPNVTEVVIFTDGCCPQNRCKVVANSLLQFLHDSNVTISHHYLEVGHTQMECDSAHACIERSIKKRELYTPRDYQKRIVLARINKYGPYETVMMTHRDFRDYTEIPYYPSIRPGNGRGENTKKVVDIRALQYRPDLSMHYKINLQEEWQPMDRWTPRQEWPEREGQAGPYEPPPLYPAGRPGLTAVKYKDLQTMLPYIKHKRDVTFFKGLNPNLPNPPRR